MVRFLCKVSSYSKLPTFLEATALQHCLNHLPPYGGQSADFSRLIVLTVYGLVPFIVSFHDLRLVCQDADETGLKIVRLG